MTSCNALSLHGKLAQILLEDGLCSDVEESLAIAEVILDVELEPNDTSIDETSMCVKVLTDHHVEILANIEECVAIEGKQAEQLYSKFSNAFLTKAHVENQDDEETGHWDGVENDAEYLQDGECELCDRYIKLTKHHLIPKETWSRIRTKFVRAAEEKAKGEVDKARSVLGPGLIDVLERLSQDKSIIRDILHETCNICRQCHSAVHRAHCNMDLALHYNSVDKLLEDGDIRKFCRWASKQQPRKYKR